MKRYITNIPKIDRQGDNKSAKRKGRIKGSNNYDRSCAFAFATDISEFRSKVAGPNLF